MSSHVHARPTHAHLTHTPHTHPTHAHLTHTRRAQTNLQLHSDLEIASILTLEITG